MKVFGITSSKGGVGKTTNCANVGGIFADMGLRVLMIDTDPMQSLSHVYALSETASHGLTRLMMTADFTGCISKTVIAGLDIVIGDDTQAEKGGAIQQFLTQSTSHYLYLSAALKSLAEQGLYDVVLIDTRGALGYVQEAVVFASDELIVPLQPTVLDIKEAIYGTLPALTKMAPAPGMVLGNGKSELPPVRLLLNRAESTNIARNSIRDLQAMYSDPDAKHGGLRITVFNTTIPKRTILGDEALNHKQTGSAIPAHRLEIKRPKKSPNVPCILEVYKGFAAELIPSTQDLMPVWEGAQL